MLKVITAICSSIASGMALFLLVGAYFWLRYYVLQRQNPEHWKCQPERWPNRLVMRRDLFWGTLNLLWASTLSGLFTHYMVAAGRTAIYFSATQRGIPWLLASTVIYFCMIELMLYWSHRIFHTRLLFRWIHRWHHQTLAPTTFNSPSMHPLEYLVYQLLTAAPLLVLPIYGGSVMFVLLLNFSAGLLQHSGVRIYLGIPGVPSTLFHDDHHRYFHCNYGLTFSLIDRFYGTLRRHNRRYGVEIFGGHGAPLASAGEESPFVDYHRPTESPARRA